MKEARDRTYEVIVFKTSLSKNLVALFMSPDIKQFTSTDIKYFYGHKNIEHTYTYPFLCLCRRRKRMLIPTKLYACKSTGLNSCQREKEKLQEFRPSVDAYPTFRLFFSTFRIILQKILIFSYSAAARLTRFVCRSIV